MSRVLVAVAVCGALSTACAAQAPAPDTSASTAQSSPSGAAAAASPGAPPPAGSLPALPPPGAPPPPALPPPASSLPALPPPGAPPPFTAALPPVVSLAPGAPLPPPDVLADVVRRLADPDVAGVAKLGLVEDGTDDDAARLDAFVRALRDSGHLPVSVTALGVVVSERLPGAVDAEVTVVGAPTGPALRQTLPMTFVAAPPGWRLSREATDLLLATDPA